MSAIVVANAPVSFGIFEAAFGATKQLPYTQVLSMIVEAGYQGTELGPYGYLPTEPEKLDRELRHHGLKLGSSFVPLALADAHRFDEARAEVRKVAALLRTQGVEEVIIADAGDARRRAEGGRRPAGWTDAEWKVATRTLDTLARELRDDFGMRVVVHHHVGTYLETPEEIDRMLDETDPSLVGLLLDTGHYVYGGGDPVAVLAQRRDRIWYLHYKDVDEAKLERIRREKIDMDSAWRLGVFVPLGRGQVDFATLTRSLKDTHYRGWVVVEQDTMADADGNLTPDPFQSAKASREYLRTLGL